jgi:acyl carrier protein
VTVLESRAKHQTVGDLRARVAELSSGSPPEAFWHIADDVSSYDISVEWSPTNSGGRYDVLAVRHSTDPNDHRLVACMDGDDETAALPWERYANDPMRGAFAQQLAPALRRFLHQQLPEYMVPSAFVVLDTLPVSPNGKVDRSALPVPDTDRPSLEEAYVAPSTPVEEALTAVWSELLSVDRVGVHDNFFALGGHSLLATQLMSRVRKVLGVELPLRSLFDSPTVAGLAEQIETVQWAARQPIGLEWARDGYEEGML